MSNDLQLKIEDFLLKNGKEGKVTGSKDGKVAVINIEDNNNNSSSIIQEEKIVEVKIENRNNKYVL